MSIGKKRYKISLAGEPASGKTSFMNKIIGAPFESLYTTSTRTAVHAVEFPSYICSVWDCSGQERYTGFGTGYYTGSDAAIVMLDTTDPYDAVAEAMKHVKEIHKVCGNIPIVVVGNKQDLTLEREILGEDIVRSTVCRDKDCRYEYVEISSKTGQGISKVFELIGTALGTAI